MILKGTYDVPIIFIWFLNDLGKSYTKNHFAYTFTVSKFLNFVWIEFKVKFIKRKKNESSSSLRKKKDDIKSHF